MDHLPTPRIPKYPPLQIPCLARSGFTCKNQPPFSQYPYADGWDLRGLEDGDFRQNKTIDQSRSFLQEWLYFRLMAAVFDVVGIDVDMDDFCRRVNGDLVIDSTNLIRYLSEFELRFREMELNKQVEAMRKLQNDLKLAHRFVSRNCSMTSDPRHRSESWPLDDETSLALIILGSSLTWAVRHIVSVLPDRTKAMLIIRESLVDYASWGISRYLYDRMIHDNWCPHRMARLVSGQASVMGMYFASLLNMPPEKIIHAECRPRECHHMQVKMDNYQTQHLHKPPECLRIVPNASKILQALERGTIPLLKIGEPDTDDQSGAVKVEIVPFESNMAFVAISHVWAHGLGNVAGNWLPNCQLRRLQQLATDLYPFSSTRGQVLVWIDTICVPLKQPDHDKNYRRIAIDLLQRTYKAADKVLVIDQQLQECSSKAPAEENLMRILCSGWMMRLWTLQEGLLAKKLRFQFKDRAMDPEDLLSDIMPFHHSSVWSEIYEFFSSLRTMKTETGMPKLRQLWNFLQWRSTSHASDETICLSTLTGKTPSLMAGLSLTDRMRTFLSQFNEFPDDLIFMPGPRLEGDGWGWAPTSFLARHQWTPYEHFQTTLLPSTTNHMLQNPSRVGYRTSRGLTLTRPGLKLIDMPGNLNMIFWIEESHRDEQQLWFLATCIYDNCPPAWRDINLATMKSPMLLLESYPGQQTSADAILVEIRNDHTQVPSDASAISQPQEVPKLPNDALYVKYVCRMTVSHSSIVPSEDSIKSRYDQDTGGIVSQYCKGKLMDQTKWCVG